jgi:hypothetical protein
MSWSNPSAVITQWRDQLLLCPVVIAVPIVQADVHYPAFAGGDAEFPDSLPCILVQEAPQSRVRYAEGAIPLISGNLRANFYFPLSIAVSAGFCETFARQVLLELGQQFNSGLAFSDFETILSSDPRPGARASGEDSSTNTYRAVTISVRYGLSR